VTEIQEVIQSRGMRDLEENCGYGLGVFAKFNAFLICFLPLETEPCSSLSFELAAATVSLGKLPQTQILMYHIPANATHTINTNYHIDEANQKIQLKPNVKITHIATQNLGWPCYVTFHSGGGTAVLRFLCNHSDIVNFCFNVVICTQRPSGSSGPRAENAINPPNQPLQHQCNATNLIETTQISRLVATITYDFCLLYPAIVVYRCDAVGKVFRE
jgi:hypothetical protein